MRTSTLPLDLQLHVVHLNPGIMNPLKHSRRLSISCSQLLARRQPVTRRHASQTSLGTTTPKPGDQGRRQRVTVFNDDGRTAWGALSTGEKIARTTQQSFNFTLIAGGAAATVRHSSHTVLPKGASDAFALTACCLHSPVHRCLLPRLNCYSI